MTPGGKITPFAHRCRNVLFCFTADTDGTIISASSTIQSVKPEAEDGDPHPPTPPPPTPPKKKRKEKKSNKMTFLTKHPIKLKKGGGVDLWPSCDVHNN